MESSDIEIIKVFNYETRMFNFSTFEDGVMYRISADEMREPISNFMDVILREIPRILDNQPIQLVKQIDTTMYDAENIDFIRSIYNLRLDKNKPTIVDMAGGKINLYNLQPPRIDFKEPEESITYVTYDRIPYNYVPIEYVDSLFNYVLELVEQDLLKTLSRYPIRDVSSKTKFIGTIEQLRSMFVNGGDIQEAHEASMKVLSLFKPIPNSDDEESLKNNKYMGSDFNEFLKEDANDQGEVKQIIITIWNNTCYGISRIKDIFFSKLYTTSQGVSMQIRRVTTTCRKSLKKSLYFLLKNNNKKDVR